MATDSNPSSRAQDELRELIDEQRTRCLWFLRRDYYPTSLADTLRVLEAIEKNGDRTAFEAAARIRAWLSPTSNDGSVAS